YQWAPRPVAAESAIIDEAKGLDRMEAEYVRFRNPPARRLWMVGAFPPDYQKGVPMRDVTVIQERADGSLDTILTAKTAAWSPMTRSWTFADPRRRHCEPGLPPTFEQDLPDRLIINGWDETPSQI